MIEVTGRHHKRPETLQAYLDQGVKKVIVAAPTEGALNIVYGINHHIVFPELSGKLNGHAVRVPLLNASLTDFVFEAARPVTAEPINGCFREAAEGGLSGWAYQTHGLEACLWWSAAFVLGAARLSFRLPDPVPTAAVRARDSTAG